MLLFLSSIYSEKERIDAFFNPGNYMLSDDFIEKNKDDILKYLCKVGVSYTSEMSREKSLNIDSLNKMLSVLSNEGLVYKIHPDRWHPQPVFAIRIHALQNKGVMGYTRFSSLSWWMISEKGIEYLQRKYRGQGVQIIQSVLSTLRLEKR